MSIEPTYLVEVAWNPNSAEWGGPTFGWSAYDDITADVQRVTIRRGRSTDMGQQLQGTCDLTLVDLTGKYNPENSGSVLNGLIRPGQPLRVAAFYPDTELASNIGFETAGGGGADVFANWTENASDGAIAQTSTGSEVNSGTYACKLTAGSAISTYVYQAITVTANTHYVLSFYTRGDGTDAGRFYVYDNTNSAYIISTMTTAVTSTTYTKFAIEFTTPTGCTQVHIALMCPSTDTAVACYDDVSLKKGAFLFYGFLDRIEHDPAIEVRASYITAVDVSSTIARHSPNIADMPGDPGYTNWTVGELIAELLDVSAQDKTRWSDCDQATVVPTFAPDGTKTALALMTELCQMDRGTLFIAADGKTTYRDTNTLYKQQTALATFDETLVRGLRSSISNDNRITIQDVTRSGGTTQTAYWIAPAGQANPGISGSPLTVDADFLPNDEQAYSLAQLIVSMRGSATSPAREIHLTNADTARLALQMYLDLADYVAIDESAGGTAFSGWVEAITHNIGWGRWDTTYAIQKRTATIFTIGTSKIDSTDILGYP